MDDVSLVFFNIQLIDVSGPQDSLEIVRWVGHGESIAEKFDFCPERESTFRLSICPEEVGEMAGIHSALALAGSPANYLAGESGTIMVSPEDRIPPDIILLEPPLPTEEADRLAARIKEGEAYDVLGIVSTDAVPRKAEQARWFMRR